MKDVNDMTRWEMASELRAYVHPLRYQTIFEYPTAVLGALVAYYRIGAANVRCLRAA